MNRFDCRLWALWLVALGLVSLGGVDPARASQEELFGPSIQSVGLAGAGTVLEDGAAGVSTNPAALGLIERDPFRIHYLGGEVMLSEVEGVTRLDGSDEVMPAVTVQPQALSVDFGKRLGPWLALGAHMNLPVPWLYFHETKDPWVPYSLRWQNRLARAMGSVGLSVRLPVRGLREERSPLQGGVWLGLGLSIRPRGIINVDLDLVGVAGVGDEEGQVNATLLDVDLAGKYVFRPHVGLLVDLGTFAPKLDGLRLGVSYRSEVRTDVSPIRLDVEVLELEEVNAVFSLVEKLQAEVWLGLTDMYDPHQVRVSLGAERPRFALTGDVQVNLWSALVPSYGSVVEDTESQLTIEFAATGEASEYPVVGGRAIDPDQFRDTVDAAVGVELRPPGLPLRGAEGPLELRVRLGFRYQMGVARPVDGPSGLMDSDSFTGAAGLGAVVPLKGTGLVRGPLRFDWAIQVVRLTSFELPKTGATAGTDLPVRYSEDARWPGGWVVVSGASVGAAF